MICLGLISSQKQTRQTIQTELNIFVHVIGDSTECVCPSFPAFFLYGRRKWTCSGHLCLGQWVHVLLYTRTVTSDLVVLLKYSHDVLIEAGLKHGPQQVHGNLRISVTTHTHTHTVRP